MSTKKPASQESGKKTAAKKSGARAAGASESRREALRQQQAAQARSQRNSRIMMIVAGIVALAILAVVGTVIWQDQAAKRERERLEAGSQITPPNAADKEGVGGITVNPKTADKAKYTMDLFIDYQCPYCAETEKAYGAVWKELADEGFIKLRVHTMTFMDEKTKTDHSTQLAIGAACADTRGKYWQFHTAAFNNQNATMPLYTDEVTQKTVPQEAGLTGADLDAWKKCFENKSTATFVRLVDEQSGKQGVTGTPTLKINGKNPQIKDADGKDVAWWTELDPNTQATTADWKKLIEKHAKA
ncbi:DsbA family protein [Aestuariimicrobium sp. p3-SID1156]|uniref:DsbA family protein n=1 Tax=Aestuariimicrobium sp. p3-SID1156 TaxID=2916038 RepID=UPI00223A74C0|nr:DsbA family protein [Aestuariimicrobium sp. p3-SID1156]MCT1459180.1 DsbA family protein [Aestuariimicrobium sp. p3-SID1156]